MEEPIEARTRTVVVAGHALEVRTIGSVGRPDASNAQLPVLVFLHEGLGCQALWRNFPDRVCAAAGLPGVVYSRFGYGASDPFDAPLEPGFMHDEARVALPALLAVLGIERTILVGHSDGASIALIYAGERPRGLVAVVALAPHLFVEPITIESIGDISRRFPQSDLPRRMAKYHRDPVATFRGWADIWLDPRFESWNIEAEAANVRCPVLAVQGLQDEYGTMEQVRRVGALCAGARWIGIDGCGHSPHLDQPDRVLREINEFIARLGNVVAAGQTEEHQDIQTK